jgi:hypothetical protein
VAKRGKSSKGEALAAALVLVILVVTLYAAIFQTEEMNQLFNWIFMSH